MLSLRKLFVPKSNLWVSGLLHRNRRKCATSVLKSEVGFNNYDAGRKEINNMVVPEYFNFCSDVIDNWARLELENKKSKNHGLWFLKEDGKESKWSYADLSQQSQRAANVLESCGIKRGDVILIVVSKIPEWWLLYLASIRIGAVFCPGTSMLSALDIEFRIKASGARHVICNESTYGAVSEGVNKANVNVTKILIGNENNDRSDWLNFSQLFNKEKSCTHKCRNSRSDEPMTLFFTSGTTGQPKLIEHTHASYGFAHQITGKYWLDLTDQDTVFVLSDPGWAKAAWSNFFASFYQGSCIFVDQHAKFCPKRVLRILQDYPITVFCGSPTAYRILIQEDLSMYKFPHLRHCLSAGEPLNPEVYNKWYEQTGLSLREGYGQSETVIVCGAFRCLPVKPGSIGKPAPGMNVKIVDENENEVERGLEGDISIEIKPKRPIGLFKQFIKNEEKTENAFKGKYFHTGDRGVMDDDDYIWYVSRDDDVINSSGYRIGPFEVESVLIEHPAVVESAIVSSPDEKRGEVVKAFVILHKDFENQDRVQLISELQDYVKKKTAPYKYPRKIEFVDDLPKTVSGKIRRVQLRHQEWHNSSS